MFKFITALTLFIGLNAQAANMLERQEHNFYNLLQNAGFENGLAKYTPTSATTVTLTSGANALIESTSLTFTATAASQTVQSALMTVPAGLQNADCEASLLYKTNSSVYRMRVLNSSGTVLVEQALPPTSSPATAKVFVPCGSTSLRKDVIASATAAGAGIIYDQNYLGQLKSSKTGAIIEATKTQSGILIQAVTSNPTKGGTIFSDKIVYGRVGDKLLADYEYEQTTAGVAGTGEYLYSLPTGMSFGPDVFLYSGSSAGGNAAANANLQRALVGYGLLSNNSARGNVSLVAYDATRFRVIATSAFATYDMQSNANQNLNNASLSFKFRLYAQISGFSGSGTSFDYRCPNDISCENVFSAKVSTGAVVSDENLDWLSGCAGTTTKTCTFNTGIFTVAPNCVAVSNNTSSAAAAAQVSTITANSVVIIGLNSTNASALSVDFNLKCQKQGADFVAKRAIEGFMSKTVTSTGNFIERMERVRFGGATETTTCTTSPCTLYRNSGGISSVTRASAGNYTINFPAGTFSQVPMCWPTGQNVIIPNIVGTDTLTSVSLIFYNTVGGAVDTYSNVLCFGAR